MKPILYIITIIILLLVVLTINNRKIEKIKLKSQELWLDHVYWTRLYIVSAINKLPDVTFNETRLMTNQEEIGNLYRPYLGNTIADNLVTLLKQHISIAGTIVNDVITSVDYNNDVTSWQQNATSIAKLIDPSGGKVYTQVNQMMLDHLDGTTQELLTYFQSSYDDSISEFEKVKIMIINMSNTLVNIIC